MSEYRIINDLQQYVKTQMENQTKVVLAKKVVKIAARPGKPGEEITSWTVDKTGAPIAEKIATVKVDTKTGNPGWVATKIDAEGKEIIDQNGHSNQWIIEDSTFHDRYESASDPSDREAGIYQSIAGVQKFLCLHEAITIFQFGEKWNIDEGLVNITNENDYYVIGQRDFADTYQIVSVCE